MIKPKHLIHIEILQSMLQYIFIIYILNTYSESIYRKRLILVL